MARIANTGATYRVDLGDGEYIDIRDSIAFGDLSSFVESASQAGSAADKLNATVKFLEFVIVSWNLRDGNGNAVPFAVERIRDLDVATVMELQQVINTKYGLDKKKETPSIA